MKTIKLFFIFLCTLQCILAQGKLEFKSQLFPIPGAPVTGRSGTGYFELMGNQFTGGASIVGQAGMGRLRFGQIERADGTLLYDTIFFQSGCATEGNQCVSTALWFDLTLSDSQMSELIGGGWNVRVGMDLSPDEIFLGQIQLVPEPSTLALLTGGLFFTLATKSLRNKKQE